MNNTNEIAPTSLSYAGGGVQPNFSAVGRNQQISQSNGANYAVGKKLSIIHCALLIIACLFFGNTAFAQMHTVGGIHGKYK